MLAVVTATPSRSPRVLLVCLFTFGLRSPQRTNVPERLKRGARSTQARRDLPLDKRKGVKTRGMNTSGVETEA
jgi:hypothetical protein